MAILVLSLNVLRINFLQIKFLRINNTRISFLQVNILGVISRRIKIPIKKFSLPLIILLLSSSPLAPDWPFRLRLLQHHLHLYLPHKSSLYRDSLILSVSRESVVSSQPLLSSCSSSWADRNLNWLCLYVTLSYCDLTFCSNLFLENGYVQKHKKNLSKRVLIN